MAMQPANVCILMEAAKTGKRKERVNFYFYLLSVSVFWLGEGYHKNVLNNLVRAGTKVFSSFFFSFWSINLLLYFWLL